MGGLVGIALGAASGLGQAAENMGTQMQKTSDAEDLQAQQEALETAKAESIAKFNNELTLAPTTRAGQYLAAAATTPVPAAAPPVSTLSGYMGADKTTQSDGSPNIGLQGSIADLTAQANALPNPADRDAMLAQINDQQNAESGLVSTAYQNQTTVPTFQQAVKSAQQTALDKGDLPAYTALKTIATDHYMTVADGAAVIDTNSGTLAFQNGDKGERFLDRTLAFQDRTAAMLAGMNAQQANNQARTQIASLDTDIKSSTTMVGILNTQLLTTPAKDKPAIQAKIDAMMGDIADAQGQKKAYMNQLGGMPAASATTTPPASATAPAQPAPTAIATLPPGAVQIGTAGGKPVYQTPDGKKFQQQ